MKRAATFLAVAVALQCVAVMPADARPGGGGGRGFSRPASRPAPRSSTQSSRQGGFNVPTQDYKKPATTNNNNRNNNRTTATTNNRTNVNNTNRTTVNRNTTVNNTTINRTVVRNPVYTGPAWGWNHGVVWTPAYGYWGGGFWGAFAIGVTAAAVSAAVYGSIVSNNVTYNSYQVQPSSPGATLLSNYHLTQTPCGPPNLVVIFGPSNSVICAYPNDIVAAGEYNLDTATLSLTSR